MLAVAVPTVRDLTLLKTAGACTATVLPGAPEKTTGAGVTKLSVAGNTPTNTGDGSSVPIYPTLQVVSAAFANISVPSMGPFPLGNPAMLNWHTEAGVPCNNTLQLFAGVMNR